MKLVIYHPRRGHFHFSWTHIPPRGAHGAFYGNREGRSPISLGTTLDPSYMCSAERAEVNAERAIIIAFNNGDTSSVTFS